MVGAVGRRRKRLVFMIVLWATNLGLLHTPPQVLSLGEGPNRPLKPGISTQIINASDKKAQFDVDAILKGHGDVSMESFQSFEASGPEFDPVVPQSATGYWNLDGKNKTEVGGDLTIAVLALECEARGIAVARVQSGATKGKVAGKESRARG